MKRVVDYVVASHGYSQCRACWVTRQHRSTRRKLSTRDPRTEVRQRMHEIVATRIRYGYRRVHVMLGAEKIGEVLPNVWLGTSIEDADVVGRIEHLRKVPAAIRFISFEPLIGAVGTVDLNGIHWAIVGGESGKSTRPIREEWIDEIHARCLSAGTAFFKQWGDTGQGQ